MEQKVIDPAVLEDALAELRPSFDADGFDLRAGEQPGDGTVAVVLEATPQACHDCLVPDSMLVQMLQQMLQSRDPEAGPVTLTKVGFDNAGGHA